MIILYSSGYRYNFKKHELQKTGLIFLETNPKEVDILLNQKIINQNSPIHITNLLPNQYNLKITKDGYIPWEKNINVYQGESTAIQYIRLFKENSTPQIIAIGSISHAILNDKKSKIAYLEEGAAEYALFILNVSDNSNQKIYSSKKPIKNFEFINSKLIIHSQNNIVVADSFNIGSILNFSDLSGIYTAESIKASKANPNYIHYLKNGQLQGFDLITKESQSFDLSPAPILDYYIDGSQIYFLNNESLNKTLLKKIDLANTSQKIEIATFDPQNSYSLLDIRGDNILIKNNSKNSIILLDQSKNESETIENVRHYEWHTSSYELLLDNVLELWSYGLDKKNDKYTLFTRTGEEITESTWYSINTHILYVLNNKILKITENLVSNRSTNNLIELDSIKNILSNKKGDKIYFIATIGNQQGLYELKIQ